ARPEDWVPRGRHVASREDPGPRRREVLVDDDAIGHRQAGCGRKLHPRRCADPDDDEVRLDGAAVAQVDRLDGGPATKAGDVATGQDLHAVLAMKVADDRSDLDAEDAF